jgi:hypothetical protein
MNWDNFWYSGVLLLILAGFVALYSVFNAVIYDALGTDVKNHFKEHFSTYFYVCVAIVGALSVLAFYYIRLNPQNFETYSMIVTHISLLLSLTAVSFSTLTR